MKLFLVHSVYHLIYSLSIIKKSRGDDSTLVLGAVGNNEVFKPYQQLLKGFGLVYKINIIWLNNITRDIPSGYNKINADTVSEIQSFKVSELYIFNEDNLFAVGLGRWFKKNNCVVFLVQDALKPYCHLSYNAWKYILLRFAQYNVFALNNKFPLSMKRLSFVYGASDYVDQLILTHPDAIQFNKTRIEVSLDTELLVQIGAEMENDLVSDIELSNTDEIVFFTSSLLTFSSESFEIEVKILSTIERLFNGKLLILKLHPRTTLDSKMYLSRLNGWKILKNSFPAEIYFASYNIIYSFSSYSGTALFSGSVNHVWLFPLYQETLPGLNKLEIIKPSSNINLISEFSELENLINEF